MQQQKTRKVNHTVSSSQEKFLLSDKNFTLFCGGLGSGKTHGGALWAMLMVLSYPNTKGLITANSYSQLKKATLVTFFKLLDESGIQYKYKSQDGIIDVFVGDRIAQVYCISMEKYDFLRGIEVGWAWSDECAFYREEAFDVLMGRIRDRRGTCQWKGTTTPNGYNWLYTKFVQSPLDSSAVITARTTDNLENLSDHYYKNLVGSYDSKLARQELNGEFVNLSSGKVYYAFDREKHVKDFKRLRGTQTIFGIDFNVDPLCGVYGYIINDHLYIFDELYLRDSNTFEAAKETRRRYQEIIEVIPDATGARRQSSQASGKTDHEILRRTPGFQVAKVLNPPVKDRLNNINRLFYHHKITIHPSCKYLIADLEQLVHENKDPELSHISDALGYVAWKKFPLQKARREANVSYG
jgi:phage terminase large subunit